MPYIFRPLKNRNFSLLCLGQAVSGLRHRYAPKAANPFRLDGISVMARANFRELNG